MSRKEILAKIAELEEKMKKGDHNAETEWAHMCADLIPNLLTPDHREKAAEILRREYQSGSVEDGMRLVSLLLDSGKEADCEEAETVLESIANSDDADSALKASAMDYLSLLYMGAINGYQPRYDKALSFLIRGMVENGSVESTYILGDLFKDGIGPVSRDTETAMALYRQAEAMALAHRNQFDHPLAMIYYRMAMIASERPDDTYDENEVLMYAAKAEAAVQEALMDGDDSSRSVLNAIDDIRRHLRHKDNKALA